ncbi:MAG: hypothetical protein KBA61_10040 [Spirochaetes bacterium]|nr:hypothetical protein [Spirochaetota bacterium]
MKKIIHMMMILAAACFASCNYDELNDALEHAIERSWYGNWCGPMHGEDPAPGVDSLDDLCQSHDYCYAAVPVIGDMYYECSPKDSGKYNCDKTFVDGMKALDSDPVNWLRKPPAGMEDEAAQFRIDAIKLFGGCVDLFK